MKLLSVFSFLFISNYLTNNASTTPDSLVIQSEILNAADKSKEAIDIVDVILKSMVVIPEGKYQMGCTPDQGLNCSSDESPIHNVIISSFYLSNIEVTQGWWKAIMHSNPSSYKRSDEFPVEMISYLDVLVFIDSLNKLSNLNFRLPTEAEWEYSSRGGDKSCQFLYSGSSDANEVAWTSNNSNGKSHVVRLKASNELGLYDMSGNVWEWVSDWYGRYTVAAQNDPRGPSSGTERIIRGGSWAGSPDFCRNSIRYHYPPEFKSSFIGFRLAMDKSEPK